MDNDDATREQRAYQAARIEQRRKAAVGFIFWWTVALCLIWVAVVIFTGGR